MAYISTGEELGLKQSGNQGQQFQQESPYTNFQSPGEQLGFKQSGNQGQQFQQESPYTNFQGPGEQLGFKQSGNEFGQQLQQDSPYTNFQSQDEYLKAGYGAEGYQPSVPAEDHQPNYYSSSAPPPPSVQTDSRSVDGVTEPKHEGGMKEKVKEKLGPCFGQKSPGRHDDRNLKEY